MKNIITGRETMMSIFLKISLFSHHADFKCIILKLLFSFNENNKNSK